jgi:hypothetical protein
MANIFDKALTSGFDRTLVLDQREGLVYPIPFTDWNAIRVGAFFSFTTSSNDNGDIAADLGSPNTTYDLAIQSPLDKIYFGLKHNNGNFPGTNNEPFVGICSPYTHAMFNTSRSPGYDFSLGAFSNGAELEPGTILSNNTFSMSSLNADNAFVPYDLGSHNGWPTTTNYAKFICFELAVNNKGQPTQRLSITTHTPNFSVTDTSNQSLKNLMLTNSTNRTDRGTTTWSISGIPYDLPNAIFMYVPFTQIRMRIHNVGVIKSS